MVSGQVQVLLPPQVSAAQVEDSNASTNILADVDIFGQCLCSAL